MLDYIDLKYKPDSKDLVVEYYVEPARGVTLKKACEHIAGESSIGTWTDIWTMDKRIAKKLKPHVFYLNPLTKYVKIAYTKELFEAGNMPEILSSIAGNIFGMRAVDNLRLMDIHFPKAIMDKFKGPRYGIDGIRKLMKVPKRPLTGTIIKPKVGLNEKGHAQVAYQAWLGGLDLVKDDENLSSMTFNNFQKRVKLTLKLRDKAEHETGERKMYMANITAETEEMKRRADYIKACGGEYFMLDILTIGWSALQTLRDYDDKLNMVIHAHRAMHGALTRNKKHGIAMLPIAKCARLIGVDQLHIGAVVGKMEGGATEVHQIGEDIEKQIMHPYNEPTHALEQHWFGKKPVFAVCSGGLYPGVIPDLMKIMGNNIIIQAGGGCHGHPDCTVAGAKAIRQAVDATLNNRTLHEASKQFPELKKAVELWGMPKHKK